MYSLPSEPQIGSGIGRQVTGHRANRVHRLNGTCETRASSLLN